MRKIDDIVIQQDASIGEALRLLNDTGFRILLVVDVDGILKRTVTDGDLRRLLISGGALETSLEELPPREPKTVAEGIDPYKALALMNRHEIDSLPVVGPDGQPLRLLLRRDLDNRILLSTPHLGEYEMEFVEEAFRTNWIAPLGPNVDAFEKEIAEYVGVRSAAATTSGTAALHLALRILGVGPGDVVLCSTFTFIATANPIAYLGAEPVFVDSEARSWNMCPSALQCAMEHCLEDGRRPKAVIVANIYGQSADYEGILEICEQYEVPIVEDAAESLGATFKGKASGTFGRIGVFSFNGNKIITTSGGGMLVSDDPEITEQARFLSTQARDSAIHYEHSVIGYNYRMSNVLAGIGRGQLRVLDRRIEARRELFERYRDSLSDVQALRWMPEMSEGRSTRWLSVCVLDQANSPLSVREFIHAMSASNIETRHVWKPLHRQKVFEGAEYFRGADNSFSDHLFHHGVCLPSGSNLSISQQDRIIQTMRRFLT